MNRAEITKILDDVVMLRTDEHFPGTVWLTKVSESVLAEGDQSWTDMYGGLVALLYQMSFIGIARSRHATAMYPYQEAERTRYHLDLTDETHFEIHPAFHLALDVKVPPRRSGDAERNFDG